MELTLKELSERLNLPFSGDANLIINHTCGIDELKAGGLAYIADLKSMANLPTPAGVFDSRTKKLDDSEMAIKAAIIVPNGTESEKHNLLFSEDPMLHHAAAAEILHEGASRSGKVDERAVIGSNVRLGNNVTIDANAVIYDKVDIGDNTVIRAGTVVMENTVIGENCLIYPNVTIRENTVIGKNVILHPGVVIGADGFGFFQREGRNIKIPQIGRVIIEDDVEIGACTTIDRARFQETIIRKGSKLDNLIHIAHNVELGEHSLIAAQSGIAGSTRTGHHLMMGGQSGIRDNLVVGNGVTLLARTLITSKTEDSAIVAGMPSRPIEIWRKVQALINSLDNLFERMKKIERKLGKTGSE